jgi:RimJ/RimL family protein N-acetyltransferase
VFYISTMTEERFPQATLTTERLLLRPFQAGDAGDVHAVWQDRRYIDNAPVGYRYVNADLATATEWCTTTIEQLRLDGKGAGFAVVDRQSSRLVGHVLLFNTDWTSRVTEVHYWTSPWARGHGYAAESARAAARWAVDTCGFSRVTLLAATANPASRHVAQAAGFRFEGILRSATPGRTGGRVDLALYSLITADLESPAT